MARRLSHGALVPHAWALYPEMVGVGHRGTLKWAWRPVVPPIGPGCGEGGPGLLWLHTKFSVLLACVAAFLVWQLR
jgi:hypothetical protein